MRDERANSAARGRKIQSWRENRRQRGSGRVQVSARLMDRVLAIEPWLLAGKPIFTCQKLSCYTAASRQKGGGIVPQDLPW
jgi:hypothetical protein